jgi:hypothetical protein
MKTRKKAIIATAMIASGIGMLSAAAPLYAASDTITGCLSRSGGLTKLKQGERPKGKKCCRGSTEVTLRLGDGETLRAAAEAGPIRNVYLEMERNTELVVASFGPFEILAQCWQSEMGDMWIGLWALADEEFTASRDGQMAPVREFGSLVRQTGADMDGWSFVRSEDNGSAVSRDGHIVNLGDSADGYRRAKSPGSRAG